MSRLSHHVPPFFLSLDEICSYECQSVCSLSLSLSHLLRKMKDEIDFSFIAWSEWVRIFLPLVTEEKLRASFWSSYAARVSIKQKTWTRKSNAMSMPSRESARESARDVLDESSGTIISHIHTVQVSRDVSVSFDYISSWVNSNDEKRQYGTNDNQTTKDIHII